VFGTGALVMLVQRRYTGAQKQCRSKRACRCRLVRRRRASASRVCRCCATSMRTLFEVAGSRVGAISTRCCMCVSAAFVDAELRKTVAYAHVLRHEAPGALFSPMSAPHGWRGENFVWRRCCLQPRLSRPKRIRSSRECLWRRGRRCGATPRRPFSSPSVMLPLCRPPLNARGALEACPENTGALNL